jgi:hypothetical protein
MKSPYGRSRMSRWVSGRLLFAHAKTEALPGESYYPKYARDMSIVWEAFQFRAATGGSNVIAAVGVRGASANALVNADGELEPVVTLTLTDTIKDWIRRGASHERYESKQRSPETWLLFGASTAAPAGRAVALRIAIENVNASAGSIAYGTMDVSAFHPDSLTMSDVVISPSDAFGSLQRGDVRVALAPGRAYRQDETPTLYYEVYGAAAGTALTTEVRITPVRESVTDRVRAALGRADGAVSFRFEETVGAPHPEFGTQQTRTVGFSSLAPGEYRVVVTVTDRKSGRTTTREKWLQIDPPPAAVK